ncbi:MAG: preprotein translocase subunit SecA [Sulfuricurvum sp. PC08-66]|nr:MAG: preprotein translocase subunit SecA [Sulfuricurvum sp. PC08-66]
MLQSAIGKIFAKVLGTRNDKELKRYTKRVAAINAMEEQCKSMDDTALQGRFAALKAEVQSGQSTLDSVLVEAFAITREASRRILGMRHFDVQLLGGMVLHEGRIAEMKTGEGKTLVATLAVALNAMTLKGVHVVTVNDYLAKRDGNEMRPLYEFLGYSVGILVDTQYDDRVKKAQYAADITYGTNNEYGFDYLRDNMKYSLEEMVQRGHNFVIVDEVDSILIDEARTPLIISGPSNRQLQHYVKANEVAKTLVRDTHFAVDEKNRTILINEEGIAQAEKLFGVENMYDVDNAILAHHLDQALKANNLFTKDVDYVLQNGEIIIVDEFTGRLSEGRRYSEGLHQALEAKEGVAIKEETQTLADITFQNYFRLYNKIAGMTGTAQTEATEFGQIYNLEVISIPTNVPIARKDHNDLIYKTEREKFNAVIEKIQELHTKGQPILIGTASIEKSETLHALLKKAKIPHTVLNAKQHEQEGEIIKRAGVKGAVTVATNMAGRGVDIKIDDDVRALGGLYIIGTERHENRRIDNQLRGRAGRQGDPGVSQFYLSLEDGLLRIFGSERIKNIMERLGIKEGEFIESRMVTNAVEKAQKKVENLHFESRKHVVEYDDVANAQRKIIYRFRNQLLDAAYDIDAKIVEIRAEYVAHLLTTAGIYAGMPEDEMDLERVIAVLEEEVRTRFEKKDLENRDYEALEAFIIEGLTSLYTQKMAPLTPDIRHSLEKEIYLKTLDQAWRAHLYQMDNMKAGIDLRGYNQKDPLVEYKKESFSLFNELIQTLKFETIATLQIIQFNLDAVKERDPFEEEKAAQSNLLEANAFAQEHGDKKISRNDPCPCGSGLKYKNCHGKSGPKKGAFA